MTMQNPAVAMPVPPPLDPPPPGPASDCPVTRYLGRSPVEAAMGFSVTHCDHITRLEQPWRPHLCEPGSRRLDCGALIIAADHAMGHHISRSTPTPGAATTLNLRLDWHVDLSPYAGLSVVPRVVLLHAGVATATADIRALDDGGLVATATGAFLVGRFPGNRTSADVGAPLDLPPVRSTADLPDFAAFLGCVTEEERLHLPPSPDFVGMRHVGAFHGGISGALAEYATRPLIDAWRGDSPLRRVSFEIRYLKPCFVSDALTCRAAILRQGRTMCVAATDLWQRGAPDAPNVTAVSTSVRVDT
ncbi:PaaI family thioesterase [Sphingomonas zeae]